MHAAAGGGAAVLRILREGHHMLHPVILELLQRLLSQGVGVPVQCITEQYSTVENCIVQYSTISWSTVQHVTSIADTHLL